MTTMRSLAIILLLIGDTSPALAQNAPPTDGYPPPAAGAAGNPATYGPPGAGVITGVPGPPYRYSHRYIVIVSDENSCSAAKISPFNNLVGKRDK